MSDIELRVWHVPDPAGPGTRMSDFEPHYREPSVEELIQGLRQRINDIGDDHVDALYVMLGAWLVGNPEYDLTRMQEEVSE